MNRGRPFVPPGTIIKDVPHYIKGIFIDGRYYRFHYQNVFAALGAVMGGMDADQPELRIGKPFIRPTK